MTRRRAVARKSDRKVVRKTSPADVAEAIQKRSHRPETPREVSPDTLAPTGSTLLNLACSDRIAGGWPLGNIVTLPGASASGKTFLCLSTLAACAQEKRFKDYALIFDDIERRQEFDIPYLFGKRLAKRISDPPLGISDTVEDLGDNIKTLTKAGKPFIYICDSLDVLTTREELDKEQAAAMARIKSDDAAKKVAEAFAGRKAGIIGRVLRLIKGKVKDTQSLVIIVQQLRTNIGGQAFAKQWRTSGGNAPFFASHIRPVLHKVQTKTKTKRNIKYKIGVTTKVEMDKNSITGKIRTVEFDIFYDRPGLDDVGSIIDYLLKSKWWHKTKQKIRAKELKVEATRDQLINYIESKGLHRKLQQVAQTAWTDVENSLLSGRPGRFK